ncbi:MAG: hypothetical protein FWG65_10975 [Turicibacter sp.]|nr:hypothetical protein [Turicibacter sp.]
MILIISCSSPVREQFVGVLLYANALGRTLWGERFGANALGRTLWGERFGANALGRTLTSVRKE